MVISDAVILGGGLGSRYAQAFDGLKDQSIPKQFTLLAESPVFIHGLKSLLEMGIFRRFVLVFPELHIELAQKLVEKHLSIEAQSAMHYVAGGETRYESSRNGLLALEKLGAPPTRVIIHDACRPYLSNAFLSRLRSAIEDRSYGAWVPGVPVIETIKKVDKRQVGETIPRRKLYRIQTPQVFEFSVVRGLFERADSVEGVEFTDDASICEYYGIPVGLLEGDERNIKLTYPFHLEMLRSLLAADQPSKEWPCESELDTIYTD